MLKSCTNHTEQKYTFRGSSHKMQHTSLSPAVGSTKLRIGLTLRTEIPRTYNTHTHKKTANSFDLFR